MRAPTSWRIICARSGSAPRWWWGCAWSARWRCWSALLGILKAGGAYLPLDPDYPPERLAFMLADAGAPVLVTQSALLARLPATRRPRHRASMPTGRRHRAQPTTAPATAPAPAQPRLRHLHLGLNRNTKRRRGRIMAVSPIFVTWRRFDRRARRPICAVCIRLALRCCDLGDLRRSDRWRRSCGHPTRRSARRCPAQFWSQCVQHDVTASARAVLC